MYGNLARDKLCPLGSDLKQKFVDSRREGIFWEGNTVGIDR